MEEQHYQLLDGKAVSAQMKKEMAEEVAQIKAAGGKIPHLAAILKMVCWSLKNIPVIICVLKYLRTEF